MVASPTPTIPISGDSMTRIAPKVCPSRRARIDAAIQPAVPPPRTAMFRTRLSGVTAALRGGHDRSLKDPLGLCQAMICNELSMCRHAIDAVLNHRPHTEQGGFHLLDVENVRQRIVVLRFEILSEENAKPTILAEMFLVEHGDASTAPKQFNFDPQCVGNRHLPAMFPEW